MKNIVIYYSRKGNNNYLARKIANDLNCDIEAIRPNVDWPLFYWLNLNLGIRKTRSDISNYDRVLLVGPIFMGRFIVPLKAFCKKYKANINKLVFVTCCGSSYEKKDEKFGHGLVFNEVQGLMKEKCEHCEAFPILLVVPEDKREDGELIMKTRLLDDNFVGEIKERYDRFLASMN